MQSTNFQEKNEERWRELETLLGKLDSKGATPAEAAKFPAMFRQICGDLSLAQSRMYGLTLCQRLNQLVIRGYNHLHRESISGWHQVFDFFWRGLPRLIREEWKIFWACQGFFWIPVAIMWLSVYLDPRWVQAFLGPEQMMTLEQSFGENAIGGVRDGFAENFYMFCLYIANNIGIDLKVFAGGVLAGVGTLLFVLFNGLMMGAAFGYLDQVESPMRLITWVSGHGYIEVMGLILSGMAGFLIGISVIRPGQLTRKEALFRAGHRGVRLLLGAVAMTFIAAIIEGYWSPLEIHPLIKVSAGLAFAMLLSAYLMFAGRARREA